MVLKKIKKQILLFYVIILTVTSLQENTAVSKASQGAITTFAVLSTTDMHGRCWGTNLLDDTIEKNNLLQVSSAVKEFRTQYKDNVVLIDTGNTFQGTLISSYSITSAKEDFTGATPMAIGLKYLQYDAFILGNHEFDYPWKNMQKIYEYMNNSSTDLDGDGKSEASVPIISGSLVYKEDQGIHRKNQTVFTPWTSKEIRVGKKPFKVGILGLENMNSIQWNADYKYSNLYFAQFNNASYDIAMKAQSYVLEMKKAGCDFIILSYHSELDNESKELMHIIKNTSGINMIITEEDSFNYNPNNTYLDKEDNPVLVVSNGNSPMTKTEVQVTVKKDATFEVTISKEPSCIDLSIYNEDPILKKILQPYKTEAEAYANEVLSTNFYWGQNTMDFINRAQIAMGNYYMKQKFTSSAVSLQTLQKTYGNKYTLDVDCSISSSSVSENDTVRDGALFVKDIYTLYKDDNTLYILPLTGAQIKEILEFFASDKYKDNNFNRLIFYGLDFSCDRTKEEGNRISCYGFKNGKMFSLVQTYNLAMDNHQLGKAPFAEFGPEDTIWSQTEDLGGGMIQDLIKEYIIKISGAH